MLPEPLGAGVTSQQTEPLGAAGLMPSALKERLLSSNGFCQVSTLRGQLKPKASSKRG